MNLYCSQDIDCDDNYHHQEKIHQSPFQQDFYSQSCVVLSMMIFWRVIWLGLIHRIQNCSCFSLYYNKQQCRTGLESWPKKIRKQDYIHVSCRHKGEWWKENCYFTQPLASIFLWERTVIPSKHTTLFRRPPDIHNVQKTLTRHPNNVLR